MLIFRSLAGTEGNYTFLLKSTFFALSAVEGESMSACSQATAYNYKLIW